MLNDVMLQTYKIVQWCGYNIEQVEDFVGKPVPELHSPEKYPVVIDLCGHKNYVSLGDYLVSDGEAFWVVAASLYQQSFAGGVRQNSYDTYQHCKSGDLVHAVQWLTCNLAEVENFLGVSLPHLQGLSASDMNEAHIVIQANPNPAASVGDWFIRAFAASAPVVVSPSTFELMYRKVYCV